MGLRLRDVYEKKVQNFSFNFLVFIPRYVKQNVLAQGGFFGFSIILYSCICFACTVVEVCNLINVMYVKCLRLFLHIIKIN